MTHTLRGALYTIPASCDRATWWRIAASLKSELGDAGFALFDSWSQTSREKYNRGATVSTWRSVQAGRISIGSLYHRAKEYGWQGAEPVYSEPTLEERRQMAEARRREQRRQDERAQKVAQRAQELMANAAYGEHPYLARKGFPSVRGLVQQGNHYLGDSLVIADGDLLIPMRCAETYGVKSIQSINADGDKKFYPGGAASATVFRLGPPRAQATWYCEGYATALSVRAALERLYRRDSVIVCFMASTLPKVAKSGYVIADHDADGTGQRYAEKTGLPWWMPPEPGDANDVMLSHGVDALADELREMLRDTG